MKDKIGEVIFTLIIMVALWAGIIVALHFIKICNPF
jgi:hypothetical protein